MPILSGRGCSLSKQAGHASISAGRTVAGAGVGSVTIWLALRDWGRS